MLDNFDMEGYWQEPDFLLADLVSFMANHIGSGLGVTLMIHGRVVTGTLVGEHEYLESVGRLFKKMAREAMPKPSPEELASIDKAFVFTEMAEDVYDEDEGDEDEDPLPPSPIRHLHLKDPIIIGAGATMSFGDSQLPIMRVRLAAVDGWMLGRVNLMSSDDLPGAPLLQ